MRRFGPGMLVTAAFLGPGTIATASAAGAHYGATLLWAVLFSIVATFILQEMAARLGLVTREGLAEALHTMLDNRWLSMLASVLIIMAIGIGNAAYEAGNISGAALAMQNLTGTPGAVWSILSGIIAAMLLATGQYKIVERVLVLLVLLMSSVFVLTMLMNSPDLSDLVSGLFKPAIPDGSMLTIIALIGTTVVPYNLFLHANAVREKWSAGFPVKTALNESRWDTGISVGLGGLITLAVISTSTTAFYQTGVVFSADSIARQLEPLLGVYSHYLFATGLLAAGITSAVTAPLAASYAVCGALGWPQKLSDNRFRMIWGTVLFIGTVVSAIGTKPIKAIIFAQATNGFLLPIIAIFLLVVMNSGDRLGEYRNKLPANLLGGTVVLVAAGLGLVKILSVFGLI